MVECYKCSCDDSKCVIIPCVDKGENKNICSCCLIEISKTCECEEC